MIDRLIVNGCSYINYYATGGGHIDLSQQLNINCVDSLAENSVCNSRILRTTLRDMYSTNQQTFYIIGTTFLHRFELTALSDPELYLDGSWKSFNTAFVPKINNAFHEMVTDNNLKNYFTSWNAIMQSEGLFEDLMYRVLSLIDTAKQLGHKILVFNTAEHSVDYYIDKPKYSILSSRPEIVNGLKWRSIPWQFEQGATWAPEDIKFPENCRHVKPGDHAQLNSFLTNYIDQYKILK